MTASDSSAIRVVGILGGGGMGTAMALLFHQGGAQVRLWGRHPEWAEQVTRSRLNSHYLPDIHLPDGIQVTSDPESAMNGADLLVVAIPSAFLRETLSRIAPAVPLDVPMLSVVKGIERNSFARPSQILTAVCGERRIAVLSGPSHSEEIARGLPASVVVASEDVQLAHDVQDALMSDRFRVYTNSDLLGVELAGALKNVMGVAAGICDGLGFGDNAKAALLTRGLAEMTRYGVHLGARSATFLGLAGVGDLITTCYSPYGRNRRLGERIGRGESLVQILKTTHTVAEGMFTAPSAVVDARRRGIELPITAEVNAILHEGKSPRDAVTSLMERLPKEEEEWE